MTKRRPKIGDIELITDPHGARIYHDIDVKARQLKNTLPNKRNKGGNRRKEESFTNTRRVATDLLNRCTECRIPPPDSLSDLIALLLGQDAGAKSGDDARPNLSDQQWGALEYEMTACKPFKRPAAIVADRVGVSRQAVSEWRRHDDYRRGLGYLLAQKLAGEVDSLVPERHARYPDQSEIDKWAALTHRQKNNQLHAWVSADWSGPEELEGKLCKTQEEWVERFLDLGLVPVGYLSRKD